MLLDLFYDLESDSYKIDGMTQEQYMDKIHTAKGDP